MKYRKPVTEQEKAVVEKLREKERSRIRAGAATKQRWQNFTDLLNEIAEKELNSQSLIEKGK